MKPISQPTEESCGLSKAVVHTNEPDPHFSGAGLRIGRVLVAVDFSDCSCKALDYALGLAAKFHASVILLHVVAPSGGGANLSTRYSQMDQNEFRTAQERLAAFCKDRNAPTVPFECLVRMGLAHSEIADTAKALACDLIVMGTRGAGQGSCMGSTAHWVVHHAYCPVLTLRPC